MKRYIRIITVGLLGFSLACQNAPKQEKKEKSPDAQPQATLEQGDLEGSNAAMEVEGIKLYPAQIAETYPDAKLSLKSPKKEEVQEAKEYEFSFAVERYELMQQTDDEKAQHCANSKKGQHIHFILNNAPYEAHYEPNFKAELMEGNNVVLAFLSRSYHESIKQKDAFILQNFPIGEETAAFDQTSKHLFYSRPKGTYSGKDAERILLDFYLVNTSLSKEGERVRVTIDEKEFVLNSWQPYFVEGLSMGEHTFRIQLIDANGDVVPGPFNDSGERVINLEE